MASMRGTTLTEVLVVLGMSAMILSATAIAGAGTLKDRGEVHDRALLETAIRLARERASLGRCSSAACEDGSAYGVMIGSGAFTVFEGQNYEERDPRHDFSFSRYGGAALVPDSGIVFRAASGTPREPVQITDTGSGMVLLWIDAYGNVRYPS